MGFQLRECFVEKGEGFSKMSERDRGDGQCREAGEFVIECSGVAKSDVSLELIDEAGNLFQEGTLIDPEGHAVSFVFTKPRRRSTCRRSVRFGRQVSRWNTQ